MLRIDHLYNVFEQSLRNAWISNVFDRKPTTCITFSKHFQKMHVFKNIVFLRKHQIFLYQVKVFASQTLYRWSFPEVGNGRAGREIN